MSKHTPGPWRVIKERMTNGNVVIGVDAGTKHWVAKIPEDTENGFEREEANALLIAAAPEMLEALKRLLSASDELADEGDAEYMGSAISFAHKAIAKAEGRES